jgi:hypothetical protein
MAHALPINSIVSPSERSNTGTTGVSALTEREDFHGWRFEMALPGDPARSVTLALSWVDYEYWSHGAASPSRVAEAVVRGILDAEPARELPDCFDASTARRWVRDLDRRIREML